jgi:2Fe-2S ferredoxin
MPKIIVTNLFNKVISFDKNNENPVSVLALLQKNKIDWMHACGAKGNCTTCKFQIIQGADQLMPLTMSEQRYMRMNRLLQNQRLACQAIPFGDISITVPDKYKLPHLTYSN